MNARTALFGTIGLLATALAALVVFDIAVTTTAVAFANDVNGTVILALCGLALGLYGLVAAWAAGPEAATETTFDTAVDNPPESVAAPETALVGAATDANVEAALDRDEAAMSTLVDRLRATATETYALATDTDQQTANAAVSAGNWTDDDVAAALLAPDISQPLLARLRLWLDPESERERRIRQTINEIEAIGGES
jgi:hypothetical protein